MPDLIWTGGISETHKILYYFYISVMAHTMRLGQLLFLLVLKYVSPINAMIQEHVPSYYEGWYGDFRS